MRGVVQGQARPVAFVHQQEEPDDERTRHRDAQADGHKLVHAVLPVRERGERERQAQARTQEQHPHPSHRQPLVGPRTSGEGRAVGVDRGSGDEPVHEHQHPVETGDHVVREEARHHRDRHVTCDRRTDGHRQEVARRPEAPGRQEQGGGEAQQHEVTRGVGQRERGVRRGDVAGDARPGDQVPQERGPGGAHHHGVKHDLPPGGGGQATAPEHGQEAGAQGEVGGDPGDVGQVLHVPPPRQRVARQPCDARHGHPPPAAPPAAGRRPPPAHHARDDQGEAGQVGGVGPGEGEQRGKPQRRAGEDHCRRPVHDQFDRFTLPPS